MKRNGMTRGKGLLAAIAVALMALSGTAEADLDLAKIKADGKLRVATEALYEPFEFVQDGKIVGYGRDILDEIEKSWNIKTEQQDVPFAGILTGLEQKKYDLVATTMIMNPERVAKYAFTMPIASTYVAAIKRKGDDKVKGFEDLSGIRVGAIVPPAGPTSVIEKYNATLSEQGKGAESISHFQSDPDMVLALSNEQIDMAIENQLPLNAIIKKQPDLFELVGTVGEPFFIGWAVRSEDKALRDAINDEIRRLRDNGTLATLQKKWFGFEMPIPDTGYMPAGGI